MSTVSKLLGTGLMACFVSLSSAGAAPSRGSTGSLGPGPMIELAGFFSTGSMANESGTIAKRDVSTSAAAANLGWRFGYVAPLLVAEYRFYSQMSDPSQSANQNLSGSGFHLSAGLRFDIGKFWLTGTYQLLGTYKLEKQTTGGLESTYSEPVGSVVMIGYRLRPRTSLFLMVQKVDYKKWQLGGTNSDISSNKIGQTSYGIGASYAFY